MICPVCTTTNVREAVHCSTCNWYFPLKDSPQYHIELGRAKQTYQMASNFSQMFQHMQIQSKMLEKMSFRLDGLENELTEIKKNKPASGSTSEPPQNTYPPLTPSLKAEDFDTPEKRLNWWNHLEEQWQKAFKEAVLQKSQFHQLTDEDYQFVLDASILRFVGPKGMHPNIGFELTNLSGIQHLTKLNILVVTHNALIDLKGIEYLEGLHTLFANSNKLKQINAVHYLPQLQKIYINANQVKSILPVKRLINLEILYCCYNQLTNLEGLTPNHIEKLGEFVCLPNDKINHIEVKRIEDMGIACKKG